MFRKPSRIILNRYKRTTILFSLFSQPGKSEKKSTTNNLNISPVRQCQTGKGDIHVT